MIRTIFFVLAVSLSSIAAAENSRWFVMADECSSCNAQGEWVDVSGPADAERRKIGRYAWVSNPVFAPEHESETACKGDAFYTSSGLHYTEIYDFDTENEAKKFLREFSDYHKSKGTLKVFEVKIPRICDN